MNCFLGFVFLALMFVFGWGIYILIIRRIIDQDMFVSLLATFGLSLLLQQVINLFYGPEVQTIDMKMGAMGGWGAPSGVWIVKCCGSVVGGLVGSVRFACWSSCVGFTIPLI